MHDPKVGKNCTLSCSKMHEIVTTSEMLITIHLVRFFFVFRVAVWCESTYDTLDSKPRGSCSAVIVRDDSSLGATRSYAGCLHAVSRTMHTDQNIVIALRAESAELLNYLKGDESFFREEKDMEFYTINTHTGHWILIGTKQESKIPGQTI